MDERPVQPCKIIVWWAIWLIALVESGCVYLFLSPLETRPMEGITGIPREMLVLIPLGLSILLRWGGLGFVRNGRIAFALFVAGVVFGVAAAHMSLFLGEYFGGKLFMVSMLCILQYVPLFARQYFES